MTLGRAIRTVMVVALLAVLGGAVYLVSQGYHFFAVQSDSMAPAIRSGDLVIVAPARTDGVYAVGDVITFHPVPGFTTTHRVFAVGSSGIQTKGDANPSPDVSPISAGQVVGGVWAVLPLAGYVAVLAQQPLGMVAVILMILLLLVVRPVRWTPKAETRVVEGR